LVSTVVLAIISMTRPAIAGNGAVAASPAASAAPGAPGDIGYWDTGRKMGVGTALGRQSHVWFTINEGILGEVYYPTVDTPDVGTLQYVVTDGHSFAQREGADTRHSIRLLDPRALAYEVTNTARDGSYRIVTDYSTDPGRDVLLLHSRFTALRPAAAAYRVYVLFRPNVNGTSLDNTASIQSDQVGSIVTVSNATGAYGPVTVALAASPGLGESSVGYHLAASDGWLDLSRHYRLFQRYTSAGKGTVVATAAVDLRPGREVTLALAFGKGSSDAVDAARAALVTPYAQQLTAFEGGWHVYARSLRAPAGLTGTLLDQFYLSALVLKAAEDKTYIGAIVASPTIPWGNARQAGTDRVGGYHLVWARDLYEVATALLAAGDATTAREALQYLFGSQQGTDGGMPQNTWLNGDINQVSIQLDQVAYPLILAWQLGLTDKTTYEKHIRPGATFLIRNGPSTQQERWEEATGYSPSTIAAEIAGLVCAADIARRNGDAANATLFDAVADDMARQAPSWLVTHSGHLAHIPYYIRIDDNTNPNDGTLLGIANGGGSYDERDVVDAGFLELVRLGIVPPTDRTIVQSLAVVDKTIRVQTSNGPGWYRYNHDGYGEQADGSPYTGAGIGRLWPIFTGERGEYLLAINQRAQAQAMLATMQRFAYGAGMIPEQVWDRASIPAPKGFSADDEAPNNGVDSIGLYNGQATGSAGPLDWSMAQYVRLAADLGAGRLLEQPGVVAAHFKNGIPPAGPGIEITSPPADRHHFKSPLTVSGRVAPGSRLSVIVFTNFTRNNLQPAVGSDGRFSFALKLELGDNNIVFLASDAHGRATVARRTVAPLL
jgi:glucoamylase